MCTLSPQATTLALYHGPAGQSDWFLLHNTLSLPPIPPPPRARIAYCSHMSVCHADSTLSAVHCTHVQLKHAMCWRMRQALCPCTALQKTGNPLLLSKHGGHRMAAI